MEDSNGSPHATLPMTMHTSRPTLGLPLGTTLLIFVIFSLSGIFSCCYHWEKLRALRGDHRHSENHDGDDQTHNRHIISISISTSPSKVALDEGDKEKNQGLPVIMPGDPIPKFIAMPSPCQFTRPIADDRNLELKIQLENSIALSKIS